MPLNSKTLTFFQNQTFRTERWAVYSKKLFVYSRFSAVQCLRHKYMYLEFQRYLSVFSTSSALKDNSNVQLPCIPDAEPEATLNQELLTGFSTSTSIKVKLKHKAILALCYVFTNRGNSIGVHRSPAVVRTVYTLWQSHLFLSWRLNENDQNYMWKRQWKIMNRQEKHSWKEIWWWSSSAFRDHSMAICGIYTISNLPIQKKFSYSIRCH